MKRRGSKGILLFISIVFIGVLLVIVVACDPAYDLKIENQTDMVLTVYFQENRQGNVEPHQTFTVRAGGVASRFLIEAKNTKGEPVFSKEFGFNELNDADWKVVIPP